LLASLRSVEEIATVFYKPLIDLVELVLYNTATFSLEEATDRCLRPPLLQDIQGPLELGI
jgi:hypothetical protein